MDNNGSNFEADMDDAIVISGSVTSTLESHHLIVSNRKRVADLLIKVEQDRDDLIDIFISLHIVLETGINTLFRKLIIHQIRHSVEKYSYTTNIDNISFIDKTVMYIYFSKFEFKDLTLVTKYHTIIGKLRSFSEIRNKLLHGHEISSHSKNGKNTESAAFRKLKFPELQTQLSDFKYALDGLAYYVRSSDMGISESGKETYIMEYLDHSFLPDVSWHEIED